MNLIDKNIKKFELYYEFLVSENEKYNLTAITNKEEVFIKHFNDSLLMNQVINLDKDIKICDVGSGAGFPGIPLKICYPNIKLTIVEPTKKRVKFLTMLCEKIDLDVEIINDRVENIASMFEEKFDIVTARAVANTNILLELLVKICKINGKIILYKGDKAQDELSSATKAIKTLGLKLDDVKDFELDNGYGKRALVVLTKKEKTNPKYPRRYAEILRKPL